MTAPGSRSHACVGVRRGRVALAALAACWMTIVGCASPPSAEESAAPATSTAQAQPATPAAPAATASAPQASDDDGSTCAARLHDIAGDLLLYYATNGELPESLAAVEALSGGGSSAASAAARVCPVSRRPYTYSPDGIALPERSMRLILYDTTPSHSGMRWVLAIEEAAPGAPLVTKVLALPESVFIWRGE